MKRITVEIPLAGAQRALETVRSWLRHQKLSWWESNKSNDIWLYVDSFYTRVFVALCVFVVSLNVSDECPTPASMPRCPGSSQMMKPSMHLEKESSTKRKTEWARAKKKETVKQTKSESFDGQPHVIQLEENKNQAISEKCFEQMNPLVFSS